jgi:hypothetical protein
MLIWDWTSIGTRRNRMKLRSLFARRGRRAAGVDRSGDEFHVSTINEAAFISFFPRRCLIERTMFVQTHFGLDPDGHFSPTRRQLPEFFRSGEADMDSKLYTKRS